MAALRVYALTTCSQHNAIHKHKRKGKLNEEKDALLF